MNDLRRRPIGPLFLLLLQDLIQDRGDPILEFAVIVVGDEEIANPVDSFNPCTANL